MSNGDVSRVYVDSFRIAFGMTVVTAVWALVDGGLAPRLMAAFIMFAALFLFPAILVRERSRKTA